MTDQKLAPFAAALCCAMALTGCDAGSGAMPKAAPPIALPADLPDQTETLLAAQSGVHFTFTQMGVGVNGAFKRFAAQVSFDPARPQAARASFFVDLSSIDVGGADGNLDARNKYWFDVAAHPMATFTAKTVTALGGDAFEARGPLEIKGVSREIVARFTARAADKAVVLDGSFPVQRLAYRLGEGGWADTKTIADDVEVRFHFTLQKRV